MEWWLILIVSIILVIFGLSIIYAESKKKFNKTIHQDSIGGLIWKCISFILSIISVVVGIFGILWFLFGGFRDMSDANPSNRPYYERISHQKAIHYRNAHFALLKDERRVDRGSKNWGDSRFPKDNSTIQDYYNIYIGYKEEAHWDKLVIEYEKKPLKHLNLFWTVSGKSMDNGDNPFSH